MDHATLIRQLGTALPMLGARGLVASEDALHFQIRGCRAGNKVRIALRHDDTYAVELWKCSVDARLVGSVEPVYADGLHRALESLTGLRTRI
jgi:hypothetical protein